VLGLAIGGAIRMMIHRRRSPARGDPDDDREPTE
jgi:hypothetical protein